MNWQNVTLANGKSVLVDFFKVMYITDLGDKGSTLHFQLQSVNSNNKPAPKSIAVTERMDRLAAILKAKRLS